MPRCLPALALALSACHYRVHDRIEIDGVRLPAQHEEVLTLDSWPEGGLSIVAHRGDVSVEHGAGPTTITVQVFEREPGEAHAHVEEGRLVARAGGATCGIGRVRVRTESAPGGLELATGLGDVRVDGVPVTGRLEASTGMGDVDVRAVGAPATVALASGMGDISATALRCARFRAETGMGDVSIDGLEVGEEAVLSSGLGDVEVERSRGVRVRADTGLGDVDLVESSFAERVLDTGLGRVRER